MAIPVNTAETRNLVRIKEEVIQEISRSDPETRPVITSMQRKSTSTTKSEYMRDALRAPNKDNAAMEGDIADPLSATTQPEMLAGTVQIYRDIIGTSGTTEAVDIHGRASEHGYQVAKTMVELQRDMEATAVSLNVAQERTAALPSMSAGIPAHLFTNAFHGAGGATAPHNAGLPTTAITPAGATRGFVDTLVEGVMQSCFTVAGETPNMAVMSPRHKVTFSGFPGLAMIRETQSRSRDDEVAIVYGADRYVSNFGPLNVIAHWMMAADNHAMFLNQKYNDVCYLRGFQKKRLGIRGDSIEDLIIAEGGFRVRAEKPQGIVHDLT